MEITSAPAKGNESNAVQEQSANGKQYMVGKVCLEKLNARSKIDGVGIILAPNAKLIPQKGTSTAKELAVG